MLKPFADCSQCRLTTVFLVALLVHRLGVLQGVPTDVEVALTPEEMEGLDEAGLKALYEEKVRLGLGLQSRGV